MRSFEPHRGVEAGGSGFPPYLELGLAGWLGFRPCHHRPGLRGSSQVPRKLLCQRKVSAVAWESLIGSI